MLAKCQGAFQCDCRGVGADWEVAELREIASALLGDVDLVPEPEQMTADFTDMMQRSMGERSNDVALRLWTPQGATVSFVKQVAPHIEDLTDRRTHVTTASATTPPAHGATRPASSTSASSFPPVRSATRCWPPACTWSSTASRSPRRRFARSGPRTRRCRRA